MQHDILCNGDSRDCIFFNIFNRASKSRVPDGEYSRRDRMLLWHEMKWRVKRWREWEEKREKEILASQICLSSLHFVLCSVRCTVQSPCTERQLSDNKNALKKDCICTTLMVWHLYCTNIKPSPLTAEEQPVNGEGASANKSKNLQMSPLQQSSQGLLFL